MFWKRLISWTLFSLLLVVSLSAQEVRTNEKGEKIIVYPDGTWEYFNPGDENDPFSLKAEDRFLPADETAGMSPKEKATYLEEKSRKEAILLAEQFYAEAAQLKELWEQQSGRETQLKNELGEMKSRPKDFAEQEIREAERRLKEASETTRQLKARYERANDRGERAQKSIYLSSKKRAKILKELKKETDSYESQQIPVPPTFAGLQMDPNSFLSYDPSKDVMQNPPDDDCILLYEGTDQFTGKFRKDVQPAILFTHTDEKMRPYLDGREYLTCEANLTSMTGGLVYLLMEISIVGTNVPIAYGGIANGSVMTVYLLDGKEVALFNTLAAKGRYNPLTETYTYKVQYQLSAYAEKMLRNGEVDKIRVIWKAGYEEYEVFDLDFFYHQLKCLGR
jgi:hypothetical protein